MESIRLTWTLSCVVALAASATAQVQWTQSSSIAGGLHYGAATFDASRGKVLVFGGQDAATTVRNDTREWDGANWTTVTTNAAPPARCFHGYCYDSGRQRIVMFGGLTGPTTRANDTWEFSNGTWTQKNPANAPVVRQSFGMAYDAARGKTVLFGGWTPGYSGGVAADTWLYDGTNWTQVNPPTSPPARYEQAMVYDSARQKIVMFGGSNITGVTINDTWEWDGTTWTQRSTGGPQPRYRAGAAFDEARRRTVVYGGARYFVSGPVIWGDVWEWDGSNWTQTTTTGPSAREGLMMDYDANRKRVVMVGGFNGNAETWEYHAPFWVAGQGLVAGSVPITWSGSPDVGKTFTLSFASPPGLSWIALGSGQCLQTPVQLGAPPLCADGYIWVVPLLSVLSVNATFPLTVPNVPALAGQIVCAQGVSVQPANCPQLTDALQITIQP